jgi:hypothetical protein
MSGSGSEEEFSSEKKEENAKKKVHNGYRYRYMIVTLPIHDRYRYMIAVTNYVWVGNRGGVIVRERG